MPKRFVAIWFRHLVTDWIIRRRPELSDVPFVLASPERGRMMIRAASKTAEAHGVKVGMVVADSRAILPHLQVFDDMPERAEKLLHALGEWCLRFTPSVGIDLPNGLLLDVSGCAHLWGGEREYLKDILSRLRGFGYDVRAAMADTVGTAWAIARYGQTRAIIESGKQVEALLPLPPSALRLEQKIVDRMARLGMYQVRSFISISRSALRRRFGTSLLSRLDQALGQEMEPVQAIQPVQPYQERLPSLEPIRTAVGIEIALRRLLEALCQRLEKENLGLRVAVFKGYRIDNNLQQVEIGTSRASRNVEHLFRLFELRISSITPALGIELFILEAPIVEELSAEQEALWDTNGSHDEAEVAELLDRLGGKVGSRTIHRYLPQEYYWPERSVKPAASLQEPASTEWQTARSRPVHLLSRPELINVAAPIPDYPPMLFQYKGSPYRIIKSDGPERIETEWWLEQSLNRDYYSVEDEAGARYWIFRLGNYTDRDPQWFLHGFFA
jgi:protein ImuB